MNATLLSKETETLSTEMQETQSAILNELRVVELAYVGGGMVNVAFA